MKKITKTAKLTLNAETIKSLSDPQLREAAGGLPTVLCTNGGGCTNTCYICPSGVTGCICISQNRTNC